ncbi:rRNA biogenesis protein rrp36 [Emydomyces testavorans]|uniref:rRNA biogenesis protein RRP36 n=1 Tax=Emydomyces testavorans TaxID=2070801 RepID=A0AAF0ILF4_9EURO|nr:rRNA biogenesis protein rrp36 [Emydomyces testavorans]
MTLSSSLNRRIKAHVEEDDFEEFSDSSPSASDRSEVDSDEPEASSEPVSDEESEDEDEDLSDTSGPENATIDTSLNQISFGALAKAQASLGSAGKRKRDHKPEKESDPSPLHNIHRRFRAAREEKDGAEEEKPDPSTHEAREHHKKPLPHRSSKHAPTVQSSKLAVSRKRTVVDPGATTAPKPRDPRFDPVVLSHSTTQAAATNKNYSFLTDYRHAELAALKQQYAQNKDALEKEKLNLTIASMVDKWRAWEWKQRMKEVMAEHKRKERELIREGRKSKPYFLKKGDVKKEVLKQRYEEMGAKERQKSIERRRKKVAARERREMPAVRRTVEE